MDLIGNIKFIRFAQQIMYFVVEKNRFSYVCSYNLSTKCVNNLVKFNGDTSFFWIEDEHIYIGVDEKYSRFYYKAYNIDLKKKNMSRIFPKRDDDSSEYICNVMTNSGNIYYTTNKYEKTQNWICVYDGYTESALVKGEYGNAYIMDVSRDESTLIFTCVDSQTNMSSYILERSSNSIKLIAKRQLNIQKAFYLDNDKALILTNYEAEYYYIALYYVKEDDITTVCKVHMKDIVDFCVEIDSKTIYFKCECGVRDELYMYDITMRCPIKIDLPDEYYVIDEIHVYKHKLWVLLNGLRYQNSIFMFEKEKGWTIVIQGEVYDDEFSYSTGKYSTEHNISIEYIYWKTRESRGDTIIWIHGGPHEAIRLNNNGAIRYFLQKGYDVISPNYRGSSGYGTKFYNMVHRNWDIAVKDCIYAINYMVNQYSLKEKSIIVVGESYGGYISYLLALQKSKYIKAIVNLFGPVNIEKFKEDLPKCWTINKEDFLKINNVEFEKVEIPLLIVQGGNDILNNQLESIKKLCTAAKVQYIVLENVCHGFFTKRQWMELIEKLDKYLEKV